MELTLDRKYKKQYYTIGNLYVDGTWICNTLEDTDRGLYNDMPIYEIKQKKIKGRTAIPHGTYTITINVVSPKFKKYRFYFDNARYGRVPRLLNVNGFDGILLHCGQTHENTDGCILVGYNTKVGQLTDSKKAFIKLYEMLNEANNRAEKITITIK